MSGKPDKSRATKCVEHYLKALIQKPQLFTFVHQTVARYSQLESARQHLCFYSFQDSSFHVKPDEGPVPVERTHSPGGDRERSEAVKEKERAFPVSTIERISWGGVPNPSGTTKFIVIAIKNDRAPTVLHAPIEVLELWYDGLRLVQGGSGFETSASKAKMEIFRKAVALASVERPMVMDMPPPPVNYNFAAEFPPNPARSVNPR
jgi:hypothetical protein